jgi:hypothetical protein
MRIVGDKFRDKLRAHLAAVKAAHNGKADWFAKRNEANKRAYIEGENARIRALSPMMSCPESGR